MADVLMKTGKEAIMETSTALGRYAAGLLMKTRQGGGAAKAGEAGFTLIELLIALAVFSLGMMAVASSFMTSFDMLRTQADLSTANGLTQEAVELMSAQPPSGFQGGLANLASIYGVYPQYPQYGQYLNQYDDEYMLGTVTINGVTYSTYALVAEKYPGPNNTSVDLAIVNVTWPDAKGGPAHSVSYQTNLPPQ